MISYKDIHDEIRKYENLIFKVGVGGYHLSQAVYSLTRKVEELEKLVTSLSNTKKDKND